MATPQRKLSIASNPAEIKAELKKPKKKAKPANKSTIKPRSPIYRALYEFLQHEYLATIALYVLGIAKGAFFPACAFFTAHSITLQAHPAIITVKVILTGFCLMFSFPTALQFGKVAFDGYKGIGFAVGLELAMLVAVKPISIAAFILVTIINVLAAFYNLRSGKQFTTLVEPATN